MKLLDHQIKCLEKTKNFNKCAYYLDMGLGKTFVGSEKMFSLSSNVNLVVCQKSKINDWVDHFMKYYPMSVFDLTNKSDFEKFIESWNWKYWKVGVINYDLAWRRPDLLKLKDFTLMLDESSLIANEKSKRSKFILKLHNKNAILLSGTPCSGKYEQLWSQCKLLDWDITKTRFYNEYIITRKIDVGGFMKDIVVGYKNVEDLKSKMRHYGSIFLKTEEVMDLPDQIFIDVKVDESILYRRFMKNRIIIFPWKNATVELVGDTGLAKLLYARQLCGQYSMEKISAFEDILASTNDRLIVFYNFTEELVNLREVVGRNRPVSVVNGNEKDLEAYEEQDNSITFIQYQAGAMGLNLQKANKVVYYSLPLRSELFEQSKKRIHRIGQNKPCFYYTMICKGTVEEQIQKTLAERKDFTDELFKN